MRDPVPHHMRVPIRDLFDPKWITEKSGDTINRDFIISLDAIEPGGSFRVSGMPVALRDEPWRKPKWMVQINLQIGPEDLKLIGEGLERFSPDGAWLRELLSDIGGIPLFRQTADRKTAQTDGGSRIAVARTNRNCADVGIILEVFSVQAVSEMAKLLAPLILAPLTTQLFASISAQTFPPPLQASRPPKSNRGR